MSSYVVRLMSAAEMDRTIYALGLMIVCSRRASRSAQTASDIIIAMIRDVLERHHHHSGSSSSSSSSSIGWLAVQQFDAGRSSASEVRVPAKSRTYCN